MTYGGIDMNKSDKYYLKRGKLELSMLDDEEQTYIVDSREKKESKGLGRDFEQGRIEKVKKVSKTTQQGPQQTLKINKDIYNTLHTMGQFLTNKENQGPNRSVKKSIKVVKGQKSEQITQALKLQEVEKFCVTIKEDFSTSLPISEADQIKKMNEVINIPSVEKNQTEKERILKETREILSDTRRIDIAQLEEMAIHLEYRKPGVEKKYTEKKIIKSQQPAKKVLTENKEIEDQIACAYQQANQFMMAYDEVAVSTKEYGNINIKEIELENYYDISRDHLVQASILNQENIDSILATFFKSEEPQDSFNKELKNHIEKHIMGIKNYDNIL